MPQPISTVSRDHDRYVESARLQALPPYIFAQLDALKAQARERGVDVIDLGMGNPDRPTPPAVLEAAGLALQDPANHRYPTFDGRQELRTAIAAWYQARYGVALDPEREVLPLIGSKEGLAHLALAYINPGDVSLVPSPSYPVHTRGTILAGGHIETLPLSAETDWQVDFDAIPMDAARRARLMFFNYPNNPTAATAERGLFERAVTFARDTETLLVHDMAYAELAFDGFRPTSLLEIPGARDYGVEFHTFSKTFSMAGWRVGFVVGNARMIQALLKVKSNMDYGLFPVVQHAAMAALRLPAGEVQSIVDMYRSRRDILVDGLRGIGFDVKRPRATMYVWVPVPTGYTSATFASRLIDEAGVVVTPGTAFGACGEGYVRMSLIVPPERLQEATARLAAVSW
ncbi:MAG: LL-diaminopimelate aminotransferase [Candidatus Sericytochromatia bacterium]|nr:LL-diaminopimelate aminotransferase [Candidatus Sericytochromatia bacterium]